MFVASEIVVSLENKPRRFADIMEAVDGYTILAVGLEAVGDFGFTRLVVPTAEQVDIEKTLQNRRFSHRSVSVLGFEHRHLRRALTTLAEAHILVESVVGGDKVYLKVSDQEKAENLLSNL